MCIEFLKRKMKDQELLLTQQAETARECVVDRANQVSIDLRAARRTVKELREKEKTWSAGAHALAQQLGKAKELLNEQESEYTKEMDNLAFEAAEYKKQAQEIHAKREKEQNFFTQETKKFQRLLSEKDAMLAKEQNEFAVQTKNFQNSLAEKDAMLAKGKQTLTFTSSVAKACVISLTVLAYAVFFTMRQV